MSPFRYAPVPLTKSFHPSDLVALDEELVLEVDPYFAREQPQHELRRWEYAMALRAWDLCSFGECLPKAPLILDVGGAGSPFQHMLGEAVRVIDPALQHTGCSIEEWVALNPEKRAYAVFCISTIEHVRDVPRFLDAFAQVLLPGGLLFLTTDCWDGHGPDTAHFHWMRERIYHMENWHRVADHLQELGFDFLGDQDWTYHGDSLFASYSFCSLAMVKR